MGALKINFFVQTKAFELFSDRCINDIGVYAYLRG